MLPVCAAAWTELLPQCCTGYPESSRIPWWFQVSFPLLIYNSGTRPWNREVGGYWQIGSPLNPRGVTLADLQERGEQQQEGREQGESSGDARFVRVWRQTGGDGMKPESTEAREEVIGASSELIIGDRNTFIHFPCKLLRSLQTVALLHATETLH